MKRRRIHPVHFVRRGLAATFRTLAAVTAAPPKAPHMEWVTVRAGPLAGCALYIDRRDDQLRAMWDGAYDALLFETLDRAGLLVAGCCAWDVGAHIGYTALVLASASRPSGRVIAFEPNPTVAAIFRQHLERNPALASAIELHPVALADRDGPLTLRCSDSPFLGTIGYLDHLPVPSDRLPTASYRALRPVAVPGVTADSLLAKGIAPPDLVKIDVEGAEASVLEGARHLLTAHRPALVIEVHNIRNMHLMHVILGPLGYRLRFESDPRQPSSSRGYVFASHESRPVF